MRYFSRVFLVVICFLSAQHVFAQTQAQIPVTHDTIIKPLVQRDTTGKLDIRQDTTPPVTSISAELLNIYNQTVPKKYKITDIKVTGNNTKVAAINLIVL